MLEGGESIDDATTICSPVFNEWLSKLGISDQISTPVRLELKELKSKFSFARARRVFGRPSQASALSQPNRPPKRDPGLSL